MIQRRLLQRLLRWASALAGHHDNITACLYGSLQSLRSILLYHIGGDRAIFLPPTYTGGEGKIPPDSTENFKGAILYVNFLKVKTPLTVDKNVVKYRNLSEK